MKRKDFRVKDFMTTDLFTVGPGEPIESIARRMDRKRIRHVPVEGDGRQLVGVVSCFEILRQFGQRRRPVGSDPISVREIMDCSPIAVSPDAPIREAIDQMQRNSVDCLPVVSEGRLVGIVTERDFMSITTRMLEGTSITQSNSARDGA